MDGHCLELPYVKVPRATARWSGGQVSIGVPGRSLSDLGLRSRLSQVSSRVRREWGEPTPETEPGQGSRGRGQVTGRYLGYLADQYLAVAPHPNFDLQDTSHTHTDSVPQSGYVGRQGASRGDGGTPAKSHLPQVPWLRARDSQRQLLARYIGGGSCHHHHDTIRGRPDALRSRPDAGHMSRGDGTPVFPYGHTIGIDRALPSLASLLPSQSSSAASVIPELPLTASPSATGGVGPATYLAGCFFSSMPSPRADPRREVSEVSCSALRRSVQLYGRVLVSSFSVRSEPKKNAASLISWGKATRDGPDSNISRHLCWKPTWPEPPDSTRLQSQNPESPEAQSPGAQSSEEPTPTPLTARQ